MTLSSGLPTHGTRLQVFRLWFWVIRLAPLDVAAKAEAHRGEHFICECVLLARTEAGEQRRRKHLGRDRFLDRGLDRPAALAGILNEAGEFVQLRILRQRGGA